MTTCWPNHMFCFLLAVTMVNVQNAGVYFCNLPKVDSLTAQTHCTKTYRIQVPHCQASAMEMAMTW